MKKSMASDYMGWIKKEMEQLKTKLNVSVIFCLYNKKSELNKRS